VRVELDVLQLSGERTLREFRDRLGHVRAALHVECILHDGLLCRTHHQRSAERIEGLCAVHHLQR